MTLKYELQRSDVIDALSSTLRPTRITFLVFSVSAFAAATVNFYFHGLNADENIAFRNPIMLLAMGAAFLLLSLLFPRFAARKIPLHSVELRLTDEGFHLETPRASVDIRWPAYLKYRETKKDFLLYVQKNQVHFVPKRILDEFQIVELRELLSRHIKKG